ncbi:unnamed protein product, partial [marine sediment metagenome]
NWGPETRLTFDSNPSRFPCIAVFDSSIHIAWDDRRDGNYEIYYKRSTDNGENWGLDTRLTNNSNYSLLPSIAASDSIVHIVWNDHNGGSVIYYKRSTDNGVNWETEACISQFSSAYFPIVTASGFNVHAVWYRILGLSNNEIYYNCSVNAGVNWGDDFRLTNNDGHSSHPSIAVSDTTVHVIWADDRDGNYEIYYKRNSTGNPGIEETPIVREPESKVRLDIYPNPFVSYARILGHEDDDFMLYDILGRLLEIYKGEQIGADLSPGVYFIEGFSEGFAPVRIVKVK